MMKEEESTELQEVKKQWITPAMTKHESNETNFGGAAEIADGSQPFSSTPGTPS